MQCEGCKKPCEAVVSKANPKASEWYCPRCHKSEYMTADDLLAHGIDPRG